MKDERTGSVPPFTEEQWEELKRLKRERAGRTPDVTIQPVAK